VAKEFRLAFPTPHFLKQIERAEAIRLAVVKQHLSHMQVEPVFQFPYLVGITPSLTLKKKPRVVIFPEQTNSYI